MGNYEVLFVLKTDTDEAVGKTIASIQDIVKKFEGNILNEDNWGKRNIAYKIKKEKDGVYYKLLFASDPANISKVEGACKLETNILRMMVIRREAE